MVTDAQKRAIAKYKANIYKLTIPFFPKDADVVEHLKKQPKMAEYVRQLIRDDMERE